MESNLGWNHTCGGPIIGTTSDFKMGVIKGIIVTHSLYLPWEAYCYDWSAILSKLKIILHVGLSLMVAID